METLWGHYGDIMETLWDDFPKRGLVYLGTLWGHYSLKGVGLFGHIMGTLWAHYGHIMGTE
jgi:hypothetical protein